MARITGMVSGMDTDTMVQNMIRAEKLRVDTWQQKKTLAEWKKADYNSVNRDLANFVINSKQELGLGRISGGSFFPVAYQSLDYVKKATLSNETIATTTTTANAMNGEFTLGVDRLASSASAKVVVENGETLGKEFQLEIAVDGKEAKTISLFNKNGVTYEELAKKINDANLGVQASYAKDSNGKGVFTMVSNSVGANSSIETTVKANTNPDNTGTASGLFNIAKTSGNNALVRYNGVEMEYNSNNFEINGVKFDLKKTTAAGEDITVKVGTNTDEIFNRIVKFVDSYNTLLDKLNKQIGTKPNKEFHPLSDEEKKGLSEDEVKEWTEKAKTGMLYNDSKIKKMLSNVRLSLYENYVGEEGASFKHLTELGISTASFKAGSGEQGGKLQIDEKKLRAAIEKDAQGVMDSLFSEGRKDESGKLIEGSKGIATRIYDGIATGMKEIVTAAGPGQDSSLLRQVSSTLLTDFVTRGGRKGIGGQSDLDADIFDYGRKIDNLTDLLVRKENDYYQRFARMEKQLQEMQGQMSWIGNQM